MKPRHKSKTYRFNVIIAILAVAEAKVSLLQPVLGQDAYAYLTFALVIGNVILRELTKEPVG